MALYVNGGVCVTGGGCLGPYHLGLFFLEGKEALPPAKDAALCLYQVAADLMEALLLLCRPGTHETQAASINTSEHSLITQERHLRETLFKKE